MYRQANGAQTYLAQQVNSESPAARVAMLYERVLASLNEAIHAIEAGDVQRRCNANRRSIEIISILSQTLDMEEGGEIAANLDRLYNFCLQRLQEIDLRNSVSAAEEVIQVLRPLHESWRALAENGHQQPAAPRQAGYGGQSAGNQGAGNQSAGGYDQQPVRRMTVSA